MFKNGFRYRKNDARFPGKPDIVLPKYKTVVFVNGCFWHKHDCPRFVYPSSNQEYWIPKIKRNAERDKHDKKLLQNMGWNVLVVWECELKKKVAGETLENLSTKIRANLTEK